MSLDNPTTNEKIFFTLDGKRVEATKGETIWQVAKRDMESLFHIFVGKTLQGIEQMLVSCLE